MLSLTGLQFKYLEQHNKLQLLKLSCNYLKYGSAFQIKNVTNDEPIQRKGYLSCMLSGAFNIYVTSIIGTCLTIKSHLDSKNTSVTVCPLYFYFPCKH